MREELHQQLSLDPPRVDHRHADELAAMSKLLDELPAEAFGWVLSDLSERSLETGRPGLSAEQTLRCLLLRQMTRMTYSQLSFHLQDSTTYRRFCRMGLLQDAPRRSALQDNIKRVRPQTLERINALLLGMAVDNGVEDGRKVRIDSTVVETHIHHPTDSSLLYDGVRVLSRLLKRASHLSDVSYVNHCRRAKRRALEVVNAKNDEARMSVYRDLFKVTHESLGYARAAIAALERCECARATRLRKRMEHYVALTARVLDQAQRRILDEEAVPAGDKIVSIFEEHTDIIIKDQRDTYYGHKVFLNVGASGLVLDVTIERGNPTDTSRAVPLLKRHVERFGTAPEQASFDGGFASQDNLWALKQLGVRDVAFAKKVGLKVEDMTSTETVYKQLRRFRAGIEGIISFLKRSFGLRRCHWRGFVSFQAYVHASVLTANLLMLARYALE